MTESPERFFFIHVMKTGGGTLKWHIRVNFADREVYPSIRLDPDKVSASTSIQGLLALPEDRLEQTRVFLGHFPFVATELLGLDVTTITLVRHPVERTLAFLRSWQRDREDYSHLSLEELYDDPFLHQSFISNHQTKIFAMTAEDRPRTYMDPLDIDERRLEIAKANLERVNVVGVQERFDELLGELQRRFGWRRARVEDQNVTGAKAAPVSATFRHRIAEENKADVEFYEHARTLCERRRRAVA